jgi:hypothetical protein
MDDKWEKVRQIVREECERIEQRILTTLAKQVKSKVGFKNGQFTGLGEIELAALEAAYPAVDVKTQIKEAAAWICMNPGEAPVSNYGKFLNMWLGKHQNRASIRSIPLATPSPMAHKMKHCEYCPKVATGAPGGIWACSDHFDDALERKPRGHMWGVTAKPVAGRD